MSDKAPDAALVSNRRRAVTPAETVPAWLLEFHELDLRKLCAKLVARLPERLGYRDCSLYLYTAQDHTLALVEATHGRPIDLAVRIDRTPGQMMTLVAQSGAPLHSERVGEEYVRRRIAPPPYRGAYFDGACLIAPLLHERGLQGVLNFSGRAHHDAGLEDQSLDLIFEFLAVALYNARAHDRARTEARVDGLTGLFNRRRLTESLDREIRRAERYGTDLSLILIDLDGLKTVNDRFGHAAGDLLLQHVAQRIGGVLRRFDSAARVGGDEFVVLLPATDLAGARHVARRILRALRKDPPAHGGAPLPLTASLGVVQWAAPLDTDGLLEAADAAMYRAKRQGRGRIVCRSPADRSGH